MKEVRFSSCLTAKVRHQGPPGSARAQPCMVYVQRELHRLAQGHWIFQLASDCPTEE